MHAAFDPAEEGALCGRRLVRRLDAAGLRWRALDAAGLPVELRRLPPEHAPAQLRLWTALAELPSPQLPRLEDLGADAAGAPVLVLSGWRDPLLEQLAAAMPAAQLGAALAALAEAIAQLHEHGIGHGGFGSAELHCDLAGTPVLGGFERGYLAAGAEAEGGTGLRARTAHSRSAAARGDAAGFAELALQAVQLARRPALLPPLELLLQATRAEEWSPEPLRAAAGALLTATEGAEAPPAAPPVRSIVRPGVHPGAQRPPRPDGAPAHDPGSAAPAHDPVRRPALGFGPVSIGIRVGTALDAIAERLRRSRWLGLAGRRGPLALGVGGAGLLLALLLAWPAAPGAPEALDATEAFDAAEAFDATEVLDAAKPLDATDVSAGQSSPPLSDAPSPIPDPLLALRPLLAAVDPSLAERLGEPLLLEDLGGMALIRLDADAATAVFIVYEDGAWRLRSVLELGAAAR